MTEPQRPWICPICGIVPEAEVYRVVGPDWLHNHRRRDPADPRRHLVHTVTRTPRWHRPAAER